MNQSFHFSTFIRGALQHQRHHHGICNIVATPSNSTQSQKLETELFASLDDDTDLQFGYGVEDY